ncbi:DNA polymerase zeta catalytic subunit [Rosa sericea]
MAPSDGFSVRIVSVDFYMAPPIPGLDISYSSFHGGKVNEVPVIRIYGSTPAGQKTCLHIHRALPYLFVPCKDIPIQPHQKGDSYTYDISLALEKALKLKSNAGSKRQHVHGCSLVQARKLYGYHSSEEVFVKIYLYYPHDVTRAANLLLGGAVLDKCLQPHESHIPFILQFMIDYNLYGMGHLHLSKLKFRHPMPDAFTPRRSFYNGLPGQEIDNLTGMSTDAQADISDHLLFGSPVWISSTIPVDWTWLSPGDVEASSNRDANCTKRQSICELEGDATVDEILNQQFKMYTSLSQTRSDVKMVQSLIPIWEEFERNGIHEAAISSNPAKPLPEDVLKTLSLGPEFNEKLVKLHFDTENSLPLTQLKKEVKSMHQMTSPKDGGNSVGLRTDNLNYGEMMGSLSTQGSTEETDAKLNKELPASQAIQTLSMKAADNEALALLRWLATSQAADELNSDDELVRETILSPLLPATTIDKVLEKANMDYESESQKECQDILDSVGDFKGSKEKDSYPTDRNCSSKSEPACMIPQVNGTGDDVLSTPSPCAGSIENISEVEMKNEFRTPEPQVTKDGLSSNHKHKRKNLLWGSIPLSAAQKLKTESEPISLYKETKDPVGTSSSSESEVRKHAGTDACDSTLGRCSLRDLMRRKRSYRIEPPEKEDTLYQMLHFDELNGKSRESLADRLSLAHQHSVSHEAYDVITTNSGCSLYGKLPLLSGSVNSLNASTLDGKFDMNIKISAEVGTGAIAQHGNIFTGSSEAPPVNTGFWQLKPDRLESEASLGRCETFNKSNAQTSKSGAEENFFVDESLHSSSADPEVSCGDGHTGRGIDGLSSRSGVSKIPFEIGTNVTTDKTALNNERCGSQKLGRDSFSSGLSNLLPSVIQSDDKDLIGMTFSRKPPIADWKDGGFLSSSYLQEEGSLDDILPFFVRDCQNETDIENNCVRNRESHSQQESALGVPTHYQADGSCLYLLTPAISPPSAKNVYRWLSRGDKGYSASLTGAQNSLPNDLDEPSLKYGSVCDVQPNLPQGPQVDHRNLEAERNPFCNDMTEVLEREADVIRVKTYPDRSQDSSQISGPDGRSKSTPLSQTGFRDPASVGIGQQLTLLSIEVQSESRGDLRPDPQFDAINIVLLAIQNDCDSIVEVHVLMRSDAENCQRSHDGISDCKLFVFHEEKYLFHHFIKFVCSLDPDILMGWDIQGGSLGFLAERASHLGIGLLNKISRTPSEAKIVAEDSEVPEKVLQDNLAADSIIADSVVLEDPIIEDEWGRTHSSGVHVGGRIVLNVWRLMRSEVKLNMYTVEAVSEVVLRRKVPYIPNKLLTKWFISGPGRARYRCIEYVKERAELNLEMMNQLDMINRTSELARVFGIDFFSVLSRGSQYRVESMVLRLAHTQNYLAISPGKQQVASQPAMECIPLVMEPESGFYADPVVVLDFQSLYPSMIIAYNLCYSTCLGKVAPSEPNTLGVSSFSPDPHDLHDLKDQILLTPNGVMCVPAKVRKGVLPRLLDEILSTRIMVKQAMKKLSPSQKVLHRIFNARQLALKLIANVTYGYTAAGFSGRMPCAEIADSIVQCGRSTLEKAISYVNAHDRWKARVIYGDTDSMFVLLKGRTREESFQIGQEIASEISAMSPTPVALKMEKVYQPCFLLTKKRYVGYSYESPGQSEPIFDAKGIETVRRDTCGAVAKTMEQSLRLFFEHQDMPEVKAYLQRQWKRILSGRVSLQDFVFAKEVRLGTYRASGSSLPPAAIVATKAMRIDPRAEPRYAERVPYVVIHGEPGARLADVVVDPLNLLATDSPYRLNDLYYIQKQIIPALQRVFGLVGADLQQWFSDMPRPVREAFGKRPSYASNPHRTRIDYYYLSRHCILCGELVQGSAHLCNQCAENKTAAAAAIIGRTSKLEREMQHLAAICRHCGGGDALGGNGIKCTSLACSVFYERRKVQKELQGTASVAAETGFYPQCLVECHFTTLSLSKMAQSPYSLLLLRRFISRYSLNPKPSPPLFSLLKPFSTSSNPNPSSLSARLSFVFDQIDAIEKDRSDKDQTLQKIRAWRESKNPQSPELGFENAHLDSINPAAAGDVGPEKPAAAVKKEVEVVHPWPEWIELMERLVQQNYFDHRRKDEDRMVQEMGFDASEIHDDSQGLDFRDFKAVHTACLNFGKDRFDIFRSLSRQDIQILVGFGCPSTDKKVVFSSKLLRKHTHLDEGDVCSSCSLRNSCERAYLITNKEDEARTIDIMRVLLTYGFDPINGSVQNRSLLKQKTVKTVVRKLLHQVVKLSSVPIDPSLPPPVIKKPPPKVKQPPPPPRKRVGRDDIEMKKGDWLCSKCDFMNFAKNSLCLQCDAKRPKRQLLPGEWECPECNFLNYRRNMACFHCDCKRPPDEYIENNMQEKQRGPRTRMDKTAIRPEASNAWNFDFDDNESDGADVAAFEYADPVMSEGSLDTQAQGKNFRRPEYDFSKNRRVSRVDNEEYSDADTIKPGRGFDDFDDEDDDIDNYELDTRTKDSAQNTSSIDFSELEGSESENSEGPDNNLHARKTHSPSYNKPSKSMHRRAALSVSDDDEIDINSDEDLSVLPNRRSSHVADSRSRGRGRNSTGPSKRVSFVSDDEAGLYSDVDDDLDQNIRSRQGKLNKLSSGRKDFQRRRNFDSEDDSMSGSESENDDFHSHKNRHRGNKPNSFKGAQFKSSGMKSGRKNSFSDDDFDRPTRGSRDNRGFRGNDFDGQRMSNRGVDRQNFKGPKREAFGNGGRRNSFGDDFDRSKQVSRGNNRGFRENNFDGQRMSNRGFDKHDFKGPKREGFGKQQRERFNNDRDKDRDFGNFSNSRRVIER